MKTTKRKAPSKTETTTLDVRGPGIAVHVELTEHKAGELAEFFASAIDGLTSGLRAWPRGEAPGYHPEHEGSNPSARSTDDDEGRS